MAPLDPRLWRYARATRPFLLATAVLAAVNTALVIVQTLIIARAVSNLVDNGFTPNLPRAAALLLAIGLIRAILAWAQEFYARRSAGRVVSQLRTQVLRKFVSLGPRPRMAEEKDPTEIAVTVTTGLDAIEPYFIRYLPALIQTVFVIPIVLVVIGSLDWISLLICLVTIPLIPIFMRLIGYLTANTSEKHLATVTRLGAQTLDLLTGLPTLKAFGREVGPGARVRELGEAARRSSMATLRIAFLSSMVLELIATLSVAVVAVSVGLRLVEGAIGLRAGLAVIMLAPEVFAPLRQVAAQFHAAKDGLAATKAAYEILEIPEPRQLSSVDPSGEPPGGIASSIKTRNESNLKNLAAITFRDVSVAAPGREIIAPAHLTARLDLSGAAIIAITGLNGAGKSTTVQVALGLINPDSGSVTLEDSEGFTWNISDYGPENLWRQVIWLPQRPARDPKASELSVGQRHLTALKQALAEHRERKVLILDEPTAHLDAETEKAVIDILNDWRASGKTAIVVAHRPTLINLADQVIEVHAESNARDQFPGLRDPATPLRSAQDDGVGAVVTSQSGNCAVGEARL